MCWQWLWEGARSLGGPTQEDPMLLWCLLWGQLISVQHCADKDRLFLVLKLAPSLPLTDAAYTLCYVDTARSSFCIVFFFLWLPSCASWIVRLEVTETLSGAVWTLHCACPCCITRLEILGALCRTCPSLLSSITQKSWRVCSYSRARRWNVYSLIHFFCQKHGVKTLPALTTTFFTALFILDGSATLLAFLFSDISEIHKAVVLMTFKLTKVYLTIENFTVDVSRVGSQWAVDFWDNWHVFRKLFKLEPVAKVKCSCLFCVYYNKAQLKKLCVNVR